MAGPARVLTDVQTLRIECRRWQIHRKCNYMKVTGSVSQTRAFTVPGEHCVSHGSTQTMVACRTCVPLSDSSLKDSVLICIGSAKALKKWNWSFIIIPSKLLLKIQRPLWRH